MVCGRPRPLVRQCVFAPIGSAKADDDSGAGRQWRDPHVIYQELKNGDVTALHAGNAIGSANAAADQWSRILADMLANSPSRDDAACVYLVGFATVQNDKYLEATEMRLPLPISTESATAALEHIVLWQKQVYGLEKRKRSRGQTNSLSSAVVAIRPHVETQVAAKIESLLTGEQEAWNRAADCYSPMMQAVARSLHPGLTTEELDARNNVANEKPNMQPKPPKPDKSSIRKGAKR